MARRGAALSEEGEAEAALRGQVQDVWRQEQKVQRELREMQREQDAILQALRELRSHRYIGAGAAGHAADAGDSSSHAGSQARRARRSCTAQNMDGTSSVTSAANLRSPTRSKVPVNGYSEGYTKSVTTTNTGRVAAQRDTIARQSLYQTGRNMKDHELHAMYFGTDGTRTLGVWEESSSFLKKGASRMRKCCKGMSRSPWFDAVVGIVIVLNTICIGMSIQWELEGRDVSTLDIAESTFLTFYVAELIIRLIAWGRSCFNSPWFIFDFVLVSFGVFSDWVLSPLLARMETGSQLGILEQVLIVRILRLLRLVRALRAMELFKDMWKLVRGMLGSARTVTSACLLIFGSLYIFGCIGVELLTQDEVLRDDPRTAFIMKKYFSSLSNVILTLVQFSNYDSIAAIYVPIVKVRPVMCIYFVIIILVVPVCLMNLVTAVIVEHAIESAKTDADIAQNAMRKRLTELKPQIKQVFQLLDKSGDGFIQFSEIDFDRIDIPDDLRDIVQPALLSDLFEFLDLDGSGELDEKEFETGVCHLALSSGVLGVSIEHTQMLQLLRQQLLCIQELQDRVQLLHERGALACMRCMREGGPDAGGWGCRTIARGSDSGGAGASATDTAPRGGSKPLPLTSDGPFDEPFEDHELVHDEPPTHVRRGGSGAAL